MHLIGSSRNLYEEVLEKVEGKGSYFMGERHRISGALHLISQLGSYSNKSVEEITLLRVYLVHDMDFHKIMKKCFVITDALISLEGLEFSQKNLAHFIHKIGKLSYPESEFVLKMIKRADKAFKEVVQEICDDWKIEYLSYEDLWSNLSGVITKNLQNSIVWLLKTKKTIQLVGTIFDRIIGREGRKANLISLRVNIRTFESIIEQIKALFELLISTRLWQKGLPFYELPRLST